MRTDIPSSIARWEMEPGIQGRGHAARSRLEKRLVNLGRADALPRRRRP